LVNIDQLNQVRRILVNRLEEAHGNPRLFAEKDKIEGFLSLKTNQLFDIEDKIYIYDLTNTCFEGRKTSSKLAKFGRSKEKRSDCLPTGL
jgi:hypothetical protein